MPSTLQMRLASARAASLLDEAVRRVGAEFPDRDVDLDALRNTLEAEMAKGPRSLADLLKRGRRRVADRLGRIARSDAARSAP